MDIGIDDEGISLLSFNRSGMIVIAFIHKMLKIENNYYKKVVLRC